MIISLQPNTAYVHICVYTVSMCERFLEEFEGYSQTLLHISNRNLVCIVTLDQETLQVVLEAVQHFGDIFI